MHERWCSQSAAEPCAYRDQEEGHDGLPPPQLPCGRGYALQVREAPWPDASTHSRVLEAAHSACEGTLLRFTLLIMSGVAPPSATRGLKVLGMMIS